MTAEVKVKRVKEDGAAQREIKNRRQKREEKNKDRVEKDREEGRVDTERYREKYTQI